MENQRSHVELMLPGIDKIWVRSSRGLWIVKGTEIDPFTNRYIENDEFESNSKKRKWWQFWLK